MSDFPRDLTRLFEPLGGLGAGAQAWVYKARERASGRIVALKLARNLEDSLRARFVREADILADLDHENVVRVLAKGETKDGTPYLAMEYIAGRPLSKLVPLADPWPLFRQLGAALDAIHAVGVLHRDLKPANILITPEGRAVLADFGLARDPDRSALTQTGAVVGTLSYLAPEVMVEREPSVAADWYAWGASLYEALEGKRLYRANEVWDYLRGENPLPPPKFIKTDPAAPLAEVVRACLSKDTGDRPQSLQAVEALFTVVREPPSPLMMSSVTGLLAELVAIEQSGPPAISKPEASGIEMAGPGLSSASDVLMGLVGDVWQSGASEDKEPTRPAVPVPLPVASLLQITKDPENSLPPPPSLITISTEVLLGGPEDAMGGPEMLAGTAPIDISSRPTPEAFPVPIRRRPASEMMTSSAVRVPTKILRARPGPVPPTNPSVWGPWLAAGLLLGASLGAGLAALWPVGTRGPEPKVAAAPRNQGPEERARASLWAAVAAFYPTHAPRLRYHRLGHSKDERSAEDLEHVASTGVLLRPESLRAFRELLTAAERWIRTVPPDGFSGPGRRLILDQALYGAVVELFQDLRLQFLRLRAGASITAKELARLEEARRRARLFVRRLSLEGERPPLALRALEGYGAAYLGASGKAPGLLLREMTSDLKLERQAGEGHRLSAVLALLASRPDLGDGPARGELLERLETRIEYAAGWLGPRQRPRLEARCYLEELRLARRPASQWSRTEAFREALIRLGANHARDPVVRETLRSTLALGFSAEGESQAALSRDLRRVLSAVAPWVGGTVSGVPGAGSDSAK